MRIGKNIRVFKSSILEQFTYVHPVMPIALWGPLVVYWFTNGMISHDTSLVHCTALALEGLLVWTISEYLLHRFIFHFEPHGPFQERIAFLIHGIHHDDPLDERRLLMPPVAAGILAIIFYALFWLLLGTHHVQPFFAGFITGYLCYDYTHFAVHFWNPKSALFRRLKQNHMLHHYVSPNKRFGVSGSLWDHVFGTFG
ncbi:MAG: sterol desaturase family protein [Deltaproteobacteria bacterium]|nr:sterol desaturase family protein [Deltaproteobacteria bacterium]